MLLSHTSRFIFIKTRKTAGTSAEIALRRLCEDGDIITPIDRVDEAIAKSEGLPEPQNYKKACPPQSWRRTQMRQLLRLEIPSQMLFWNHMGWRDVADAMPDAWNQYLTFSIVRDPFEFVLSLYKWVIHSSGRRDLTIDDLFAQWEPCVNWKAITSDGHLAVDYVCRYEHLFEDLAEVHRWLGYEYDGWLPRAKAATGRSGSDIELLKPRHIKYISERCAAEIEYFGYEVPS